MSDIQDNESSGIVYGRHVVLGLLRKHSARLQHVWILKTGRFPSHLARSVASARKKGVSMTFVTRQVLDRLTDGAVHQGIAARVSVVPFLSMDEWWKNDMPHRDTLLIVILDRVQDPRNIGAVFRAAAAAKADAVFIPARGGGALSVAAEKAAAGTLDKVPVVRTHNLARALRFLKEQDIMCIGMSEKADVYLFEEPLPKRVAFVLGGEGKGIRPGLLKLCDQTLKIPLTGPAGSINVASAAAVTLYEFIRSKLIRMHQNAR